MTNEKRSIFDWLIWTLIHIVVIGAITYAGIQVYGMRLGLWVAASATVAGFASCYLFAKDVPGETLMKVWLYLCVAANAGYLVHNGARQIGIDSYNTAQVEKFEKGMAQAGKATSRRIARELRLGAENASKIELAFSDGVSVIVAILAFLELASALVIFALGSRRIAKPAPISAEYPLPQYQVIHQPRPPAYRDERAAEFPDEIDANGNRPRP